MCELSAYVAFDKATNGQTDIKHETGKTLSSKSLLNIVGEKLPPSQRSSLDILNNKKYGTVCVSMLKDLGNVTGGVSPGRTYTADFCFFFRIRYTRVSHYNQVPSK